MSELLAIGASHHTAPVEVRERLSLRVEHAEELLDALVAEPAVQEAVALSTCNRTELYVVVADPVEGETAVLGRLARQAGIRPTELVDAIYALRNCDAARHLFRVASGLDSMVLGEAEVQGQVKRAYEQALAARTTGPLTNRLFRAALATGKRVRTETAISAGRTSVASVAVDAARQAVGPLAGRRVVIVGAGETAELVARALREQGGATLLVTNRHRERADDLARRFGGEALPFDALPAALAQADIVLTSTASSEPILGVEDVARVVRERPGRPLLLVDLAVPRDVDAACGALEGVTLYDLDDLHARVQGQRLVRRAEAVQAEALVEQEIHAFAGWLGTRDVQPTLAALRGLGDDIVASVLADNEGRWEALGARDRERVEALARAVANRLLHEPTVRLRQLDGEHRHGRLQALRELFGLEERPAEERPAEAEVHRLRARG